MLFNVLFIIYIRGARSAGKTDPNKREKRPFHQPQTHQRFLIYFLFFSASDFALGFLYFSVAQFRQQVSHFYANSKCRWRKMFLLYLVELFTPN